MTVTTLSFSRYLYRIPESEEGQWFISLKGRRQHWIGVGWRFGFAHRVGPYGACGSWVDSWRHARIKEQGKMEAVPPCERCLAYKRRLADLYNEDGFASPY